MQKTNLHDILLDLEVGDSFKVFGSFWHKNYKQRPAQYLGGSGRNPRSKFYGRKYSYATNKVRENARSYTITRVK